jgi:hypothetical protein
MSAILDTIGRSVFRLGYEISPIILVGGVASSIPGGMLPIVALTEPINFAAGLLSGNASLSLDNFFAHFEPMAGATIISNQSAKYPFANLSVAANAMITMPKNVSILMKCPVQKTGGYTVKLITFMALQSTLEQHNQTGGTYTIATPTMIYPPALLIALRDVSPSGGQPQTMWQFDFEIPLLTQAQAQQTQNSAMSKITNGVQTSGSTSGPSSISASPNFGAAATQPGSANLVGVSGTAPVTAVTVENLSP